ncbi:hypothetical protein ACIOK4_13625 [Streptomyces bottropensis]|uniref:hypothetical protein n=1 Tax=Streptomyces bottropensis TaxID=42235 RepID=UPI0037F45DB6
MTGRIPLDSMTSDDLDRLYEQLERAQRVAMQALDHECQPQTPTTTQPTPTRTWTWTGDRDLPDWLTGHRWEDGQLIIHTTDGPRTLYDGWIVIGWSDGAITVASATVAERVYGDEGIAGRLAAAEAALARIQAIADEHPAGIDTALIHAALDGQPGPAATQATEASTSARPWSTCTVPADHGPHPWHDPWPLPRGQDAHCPGRPTPG